MLEITIDNKLHLVVVVIRSFRLKLFLTAEKMNTASTSSGPPAIPLNQQNDTIVQIVSPPVPPPFPEPPKPNLHRSYLPPPNLPCSDLLTGRREKYIKIGVPLYEAAIRGDWKAAKPILDREPYLIRFAITENYDTLLHIAASAESTNAVVEFVTKLVQLMKSEDLELQNKNYKTALSLAAAAGNVKTAMIMVKKNPRLPEIPGINGTMPLYMAALFEKPLMVRYLYGISNEMEGNCWSDDNRGWVLLKCVEADIFVFLGVHVKIGPREKESEALQLLRVLWEKVITKMSKFNIDWILEGPGVEIAKGYTTEWSHPSRVLFLATKMGNMRFIIELIRSNPDQIWKRDDKGKTIFHLAVKHRQINIYKLIYEIGAMKHLITPVTNKKGNNMLHMVAKKPKQNQIQNVSGAALEMQRELSWFKVNLNSILLFSGAARQL
ncbi:putative ankyrin repeat-containing domain-containing protein [Helianthus annuus]|nr:putative ankyrin repeat-containing domain-containing protein [Helianthus annuus]